jgi:predicted SprT family Zn-dependent metalloprotease
MRQFIPGDSPNREYVTLAAAFVFFNRRLFDGQLPTAIITLQRHAGAYGYYSARRFEAREAIERETDEIALNPDKFAGRSDAQILSTLVHEMVHHWQAHFGKPGRSRYHNRQWADRMEAIGLMPSDTGQAGGKRVGQRVSHYIIANSLFELACQELFTGGVRLQWQSREDTADEKAKAKNSKTKFTCPTCGENAWARPAANLMCGDCLCRMASKTTS